MMNEYRLQPTIIEQYKANLAEITERMQAFALDPERTPPDFVRIMVNTQMIIEKGTTNFTDDDQLELLDRLEKWYTDQGFEFPSQEYLDRQRESYKR